MYIFICIERAVVLSLDHGCSQGGYIYIYIDLLNHK